MQNKTTKVSLALVVCCLGCAAQQNVDVHRNGSQIDVSIGGKPFTTYYFEAAVAKPYLMPLRSARGTVVTRDYPVANNVPSGSEHDPSFEPHQRPLYFSHGNIDGLDFWGEEAFAKYYNDHGKQGYGHMVLDKIDETWARATKAPIPPRVVENAPCHEIVITGDELLPAGSRPEGYRIVDSNSFMLAALAKRDGAIVDLPNHSILSDWMVEWQRRSNLERRRASRRGRAIRERSGIEDPTPRRSSSRAPAPNLRNRAR